MKIVHSTPVLADVTSTGKKKFWQGHVAQAMETRAAAVPTVVTYSEFWQEGSERQQSAPTVVKGKNVGKKNETSPLDQAISDIESDRKKKEKKGYLAEGADRTRVLPLPMLAHTYGKRGHDIAWPCHAQPKLDGVRCLTDGVRFWSREGNLFSEATTAHLRGDTRGEILDGEIMLDPDIYTFEQTISALKDETPDAEKLQLSQLLTYHIFDVLHPTKTWRERLALLRGLFARGVPAGWVLVPTTELLNEKGIQAYLDDCLAQGHEGIILRNIAGEYKLKHRSKDLQKHKPFVDEEFRIIGYKEGEGKFTGTPTWRCVTADGVEFDACPMGTMEHKQQLWRDRAKLVGKSVTVTYQNLTADGAPRFPVAKAIRDYE